MIIIKVNYKHELHYPGFVIDMISTAICQASCDMHPTAQRCSKALRCHCSLSFHENVASGEELNTVKPGKNPKLPSSNKGRAAWPLGYLCSGRAVALVRFIFLFRKTRDLKQQMHLEGIRVLL